MESSNDIAVCKLSSNEHKAVRNLIESFVPDYRPDSYGRFISSCQGLVDLLPRSVQEWRAQVLQARVGLVRNLPIDTFVPRTPLVRYGADRVPMFSDRVLGAISSCFGTVYTIQGKGSERHIGDIFPLPSDAFTQLASSYSTNLVWHTEEAFHPSRPEWLALLCVRANSSAITRVAHARNLRLPASIVERIRQARFRLLVDETYSVRPNARYFSSAILIGPSHDPEIIFDPAYTTDESPEDGGAIEAVQAPADAVQYSVSLEAGDLLVIDNRRTLHARSAYDAKMIGGDRWLKRAFVHSDPKLCAGLVNGVSALE